MRSPQNHPPTRHIKYKVIEFAPINNQVWQISILEPSWNDFYDGLNLRLRVDSAKHRSTRVNRLKMAKIATFKLPYFNKIDHR